MNVQRIKPHLDKINSLYAYLLENKATLSRLDQDAFLASIRSLYDACILDEEVPQTSIPTTTPPPVEPLPTPTVESPKPIKKKRPKMVFTTPNPSTEVQEDPAPPIIEPTLPEQPQLEPTVAKEEPLKEEPPVQNEIPQQETTPPAEQVPASSNEEYEELFAFKEATDLSQKLSTSPIEDLSKALGMNEKYLYINELFGGDVATFQTALKQLNNGAHFDKARQYLEQECISQHNWMDKNKKIIAKNFVKLVRRRYL